MTLFYNDSVVETVVTSPASLTKRLAKGGSITIIFSLLAAPLGYAIKMLNSRWLSVEDFGLFYAIIAIYAALNTFNDLGFGYSLVYLAPKFIKKNQLTKAWLAYKYDQIIEVVTSVVLSGILLLFSNYLATHYFKSELAVPLLQILAFYFIADAFSSAMEKFLIGLQQITLYSSIKVVKLFLTLVFSYIFILLGKGSAVYFAFAWFLGYLLAVIIYLILLKVKNSHLFANQLRFDSALFKKMKVYAMPSLLLSSVGLISGTMDTLFLTFFRNLGEVGIYNVILPLATIPIIFTAPLNNLLFPLFSELEDEPERLKKAIEEVLKIIPFIAVYFSLFVFLFPSEILQTMFGSKWMDIAKIPLQLAALGFILQPMGAIFGVIANGIGLIKEKTKIAVVTLVGKILLNPILIYFYGISGAILANTTLFLISIVMLHLDNRKKISYVLPWMSYFKLGLTMMGIYLLISIIDVLPDSLLEIIAYGVGYTLIYLMLGFYLKIVNIDDMKKMVIRRDRGR